MTERRKQDSHRKKLGAELRQLSSAWYIGAAMVAVFGSIAAVYNAAVGIRQIPAQLTAHSAATTALATTQRAATDSIIAELHEGNRIALVILCVAVAQREPVALRQCLRAQ